MNTFNCRQDEDFGKQPGQNYLIYPLDFQIIPSQMEVAPPHRTVDITQKRVLSKNTKETEKM